MTRYLRAAILFGAIASVTLGTGTAPAMAQEAGAGKPSDKSRKPDSTTVVVNGPDNPVPVVLTTVGPRITVTCFRNITHPPNPAPTPFIGVSAVIPSNLLDCSMGVGRIDVHRVSFSPDIGPTPAVNTADYRISIGFSNISEPVTGSNFVALLSSAAPEKTLSAPVRLDLATGTWIPFTARCTSGLANVDVRCGGLLILEGAPVE